eukprot:scaffold34058_cov28-Tisochrysis_lutea.AAC.2
MPSSSTLVSPARGLRSPAEGGDAAADDVVWDASATMHEAVDSLCQSITPCMRGADCSHVASGSTALEASTRGAAPNPRSSAATPSSSAVVDKVLAAAPAPPGPSAARAVAVDAAVAAWLDAARVARVACVAAWAGVARAAAAAAACAGAAACAPAVARTVAAACAVAAEHAGTAARAVAAALLEAAVRTATVAHAARGAARAAAAACAARIAAEANAALVGRAAPAAAGRALGMAPARPARAGRGKAPGTRAADTARVAGVSIADAGCRQPVQQDNPGASCTLAAAATAAASSVLLDDNHSARVAGPCRAAVARPAGALVVRPRSSDTRPLLARQRAPRSRKRPPPGCGTLKLRAGGAAAASNWDSCRRRLTGDGGTPRPARQIFHRRPSSAVAPLSPCCPVLSQPEVPRPCASAPKLPGMQLVDC